MIWGVLLAEAGIGRGQKDRQYPRGKYPHVYSYDKFDFAGHCPNTAPRQEFVLMKGGAYNGDPDERDPTYTKFRVVYFHDAGSHLR